MDCVEMVRIVFAAADAGRTDLGGADTGGTSIGETDPGGTDTGTTGAHATGAGERTVLISLVNGNSPLVWDATMLGAMKVYARHRQALLVSPFIMQGANTPVTTAGALAQLNAEAVAGMAFAQLVRPGTPVVYGNTIATVSMQSGAPTYGTAETVMLGLAVTQLARRYGVPSRTAGMRTGSKTCDAEAGAQAMITMLSALLGRVHFVLHAAGFLESGLSASFAKMVMDADQLSHLLGIVKGLQIDPRHPCPRCDPRCRPLRALLRARPHHRALRLGVLPPDDGGDRHLGPVGRGGPEGRGGASRRGCGVAHRLVRTADARRRRR